ncbi:unnamed protein product [Nesidiocoris tenuis]|nr:unnamed protein product [Nesidiocoris tenuis]
MVMGDFKPPMMATPPDPPPAKKKRRASNNNAANIANQQPPPSAIMQDLLPPPPTGYGDTIVASNPFDDSPVSQQSSMCPPMGPRHMMMMGGPSCNMGPQPPMGGCGPPASPMGMSMMSSPHHMGQNRSPMCGPPPGMMCGGPTPGSPMPPHRSPTVGSPLMNVDCIGPGSRKGSPMMPHGGMNCVSPMGSPMGNGPMCSGPPGPPSMSSPIIDIRPINSPMCQMNNGNQPPQQPPQQQQQQQRPPSGPPGMNQMSSGMPGMSPNDMCKGPPVNANGPVRPPHHQHPHPHPHPHPPMQHQHAMQHPPHGYPPPKPMPVSAGKVYPVDQPMVFNPQNPNAPPIYPCGVCHKEVHDNDQAILCESGCNFWFHRICTGLTEGAYQLLTAEVYAEWVCDKCLTTKSIPLVKFKP